MLLLSGCSQQLLSLAQNIHINIDVVGPGRRGQADWLLLKRKQDSRQSKGKNLVVDPRRHHPA